MFTRVMAKAARLVAPEWSERMTKRSWYTRRAESFRGELEEAKTLEEKITHARVSEDFTANQKQAEIRGLLERVSAMQARRIIEIGSFGGGTLSLLAQTAAPTARILSLDINFSDHQLRSYPRFAGSQQEIRCVKADTHDLKTLEVVRNWLQGELLDVLFIDGDHSYSGVKSDFEMYSPFVRLGGLIAFHDIHPDYKTRYGRPTENDVGEVPKYWSELSHKYPDRVELIEDEAQDGYGIGIIQMG